MLAAASIGLVLPPGAGAKEKAVWLCEPKLDDNPCEPGLRTTQHSNSGQQLGIKDVTQARRRRVDCFYVYPTVSDQPGSQANLDIDPVLRSIALYQAARFSRDCRVFAPVYRQATLSGIGGTATPEVFEPRTRTCAEPGSGTCASTTTAAGWCWSVTRRGRSCCAS